ncbi:hypothetical protein [Pararhizobium haloflavum]|uniref:hypothetical protein n=1 Tax=Pararhizobium haloflavum TaxID=2037914 RepID=UPI000C17446C|nr:hypothetical protein [Pararhizobium haloflavum]
MTDPSDEDWETLNAYLDGELSRPEHRAFARRLSRQPELAAAAARLHAQSESLRKMRPVGDTASPVWVRPLAWSGAIAATLAIAAFLAMPGADRTDLASIHKTFLEQSFLTSGEEPAEARLTRGGPLPDLSPAGLALVAVREVSGGIAGHYAGRNACRLTLLRLEDGYADETDVPDVWIVDGRRYAVQAEGMKPDRLAAIEAYLKAVTDPEHRNMDRLAFARQVAKTETCA